MHSYTSCISKVYESPVSLFIPCELSACMPLKFICGHPHPDVKVLREGSLGAMRSCGWSPQDGVGDEKTESVLDRTVGSAMRERNEKTAICNPQEGLPPSQIVLGP